MAGKSFPQKALSFLFKLLRRPQDPPSPHWRTSNGHASQTRYQKYTSLLHRAEDLSSHTVIFHSEDALLKSSSLFPYFMLVAFEAGGLLRSLVFFLLYPLACLFGDELGLKIKVFLCFFGIKKECFRLGSSVLPKFFSQDVGREGFEVVMSFGRKVAVSDLPTVMVAGFLHDYLGVDAVVGRELKVVCGYFVGFMEEKKADGSAVNETILGDEKTCSSTVIGIGCYRSALHKHPFAHCKVSVIFFCYVLFCFVFFNNVNVFVAPGDLLGEQSREEELAYPSKGETSEAVDLPRRQIGVQANPTGHPSHVYVDSAWDFHFHHQIHRRPASPSLYVQSNNGLHRSNNHCFETTQVLCSFHQQRKETDCRHTLCLQPQNPARSTLRRRSHR
jgi:hypothetical protein